MQTSSDDMYDKFKDYDFENAKPVAQISALVQLQASASGRMNEDPKQFLQGKSLEDLVRKTLQKGRDTSD